MSAFGSSFRRALDHLGLGVLLNCKEGFLLFSLLLVLVLLFGVGGERDRQRDSPVGGGWIWVMVAGMGKVGWRRGWEGGGRVWVERFLQQFS